MYLSTTQFPRRTSGKFPIDFSLGEVFADGLRNEVGLAFDSHGVLWGVENSADNLEREDIGGDITNDNPAVYQQFLPFLLLLFATHVGALADTYMPNTNHLCAATCVFVWRAHTLAMPHWHVYRSVSPGLQEELNRFPDIPFSASNNDNVGCPMRGAPTQAVSRCWGYPHCFTEYSLPAGKGLGRGTVRLASSCYLINVITGVLTQPSANARTMRT